MAVSRPTLTRIHSKAMQKIAEALVLGKQIIIEGGKIYFDSEWYSCYACGCFFNNPEKQIEIKECPLCGSSDFSAIGDINNG
jgi:rRNA maturation endonuclease Nob1